MGQCRSGPKNDEEQPGENMTIVEVNNAVPQSDPDDPEAAKNHAAKEEDLAWMNYMLTVMWPFMRRAMIKKASEQFTERMTEELAKHPEVKIDELDLDFDPGNCPPRLKGLLVYHKTQQERNGLQIDVDFAWKPDSDFHMKMTVHGHAKGFPINAEGVGVSHMSVSGTMSCLLAPLLEVEPCVGTGQAFFLDSPQISMKVIGMKKLGPVGAVLTTVMEGVVKSILADGYILPHRFVQKVRKDLPLETMVTMKSPLPLGLLEIEVLEGKNLPAADVSITGKKSSDPYVEVKIGDGRYRSNTAENTLNPKWKEPPGHMFIYSVAQLVRITVHDDDVMGADVLGTVVGYNVFVMMQEQVANASKGGVWYQLIDKARKPAGQVKLRIRYFDVSNIGEIKVPATLPKSSSDSTPYLLTVKLLGLEAENRGDLRNTRATVELMHPELEAKKVNHSEHQASRLMAGLDHAMSWAKHKVKAATGIEVGFGAREEGIPAKRKSGKAVLWGSVKQLEDHDHHVIPPMAIRAMEKLHIGEGWPITRIAHMFQLDPQIVRTAVELRGNFEVVWHEGLHFLQPAGDPYLGKIRISVSAPKANQVRGADDHGFLGEFDIDLSEKAASADSEGGSTPWKRRIRRVLYRPKGKPREPPNVFEEKAHGDFEERPGEECTGILIELMVELRQLEPAPCELDHGMTLRSKEDLIQATLAGGVKMIPE